MADTHVIRLDDGREIWIEPADEPDAAQRFTMRTPDGVTVELESVMVEDGVVSWNVPPREV